MSDIDPVNLLTHIDHKQSSWIGMFVKPAILFLAAILVGYSTMWLSSNFVRQDKFAAYVDKQIENDTHQDEVYKSRFEITQTKLETIINQQVAYTEQLKAYNQIMLGIQKQVDDVVDRVKYIERSNRTQQQYLESK